MMQKRRLINQAIKADDRQFHPILSRTFVGILPANGDVGMQVHWYRDAPPGRLYFNNNLRDKEVGFCNYTASPLPPPPNPINQDLGEEQEAESSAIQIYVMPQSLA